MRTLPQRLYRRKARVSSGVVGSSQRPRIAIHRSNKYILAQAIDDTAAKTVCSISSHAYEKQGTKTKTEAATLAGVALGEKLIAQKTTTAVIDRSRFHYMGRVAAFVEGLRSAGIHV